MDKDKYNSFLYSKSKDMNLLVALELYFRRLKTKEYVEFISMVVVSVFVYEYLGIKYALFLLLTIFLAELELCFESRNINLDKHYAKYVFLKSSKISKNQLLLNTVEFKHVILYSVNIMILSIIDIINSQLSIYKVLFFINVLGLIWVIAIKYLSMYYKFLSNKLKFESTGFKLTMIYFVVIFLTPDLFASILINKFNYTVLYGELFKTILLTICYFFKIEDLFFKIKIKCEG